MTTHNLSEASKMVGVSRTTLYKKIQRGLLSASVDREGNRIIEVSELIRVFGELKEYPRGSSLPGQRKEGSPQGYDGSLVEALRDQIALLKEQVGTLREELMAARERESRFLDLLERKQVPLLEDGRPWWRRLF